MTYLPITLGNIPFPRDLLLRNVAYDTVRDHVPVTQVSGIVDLIVLFYPFRVFTARAERAGELPLWNPYILSGEPFQAISHSGLLYPLNLLYLVMPVPAAWAIGFVIRMFLAAWFMALFIRRLGGSLPGCIVAGIVFAACGFMTVWRWQAIGDSAIWLPMICYAVHRLYTERSMNALALAAVAFAMPVLAGHPETAAHLTLAGCAFAFTLWSFRSESDGTRFDKRFVAVFGLAGIVAVGLASVQILPTIQWLAQLKQNLDVPEPALTRHDGQGFFSRDILSTPNSALVPIPEGGSYAGMLTLLAAPFAFFYRPRRYALFFAAIALVAIAIAFSIEPLHWIVAHLPLIKSWKNARLILVADFGLAAMAGLGITFLGSETPSRIAGLTLMALAVVVCLGGVFEVHRATQTAVSFMRGPAGSLIFLAAATFLMAGRVAGILRGSYFSVLACGVAAVEMISFSYGFPGFAKAADAFPPAPVFDFLKKSGPQGAFRIATLGYAMPANSGLVYGIEMAEGYDLTTDKARLFWDGLRENRDDAIFFDPPAVVNSPDRRLDLMNVRYLVATAPGADFDDLSKKSDRFSLVYKEPSVAVFENKHALPRAFTVPLSGVDVQPDPLKQLNLIKSADFDPLHQVVLAQAPEELRDASAPFSGRVDLQDATSNAVSFRTQTTGPSVLVWSEMAYPGWRVTVDGQEKPLLTADLALMATVLPAGTHEVRFTFSPPLLKLGGLISLISLVVIGGLTLYSRQRGGAQAR
jgi:hypothetical protein